MTNHADPPPDTYDNVCCHLWPCPGGCPPNPYPTPHGCILDGGHDGDHRCVCGATTTRKDER